jgi:hypothetical protein
MAHFTFEYWMNREIHYRKLEYDWIAAGDYTWADRCHQLRWRCMDLALEALNKNQTP